MKLATSKLTPQGQISVPAAVRRHLGLAPGGSLEWDLAGDTVVVRRATRSSSEDVHALLFARRPAKKSLTELKDGVRRAVKARRACD